MKLIRRMIAFTGLAAALCSCADKADDFKYLALSHFDGTRHTPWEI